jgi:hypothetical protein
LQELVDRYGVTGQIFIRELLRQQFEFISKHQNSNAFFKSGGWQVRYCVTFFPAIEQVEGDELALLLRNERGGTTLRKTTFCKTTFCKTTLCKT